MTNGLDFNKHVKEWHPTGSRYICDPPVMHTDNDVVILTDGKGDLENDLLNQGFRNNVTEIQYDSMGEFQSWRKGDDNYIITSNPSFYYKFVKATKMAKEANLNAKADRVALFQKVLYNNETT